MKEIKSRVHCDICINSRCLFKKEGYREYVNKIEKTPCLEEKLPCFKCGKEIEIKKEGWVCAGPKAIKALKKEMSADVFKAWKERSDCLKQIVPFLCSENCKEIVRKEIENNIPNYDKVNEFFEKMKQDLR